MGQPKKQTEYRRGELVPVINRSKCEAKGPCVPVCPYGVLEIRTLISAEKQELSFMARLRVFVHSNKQAFVIKPEACTACGLCVNACPENAITLKRSAMLPS